MSEGKSHEGCKFCELAKVFGYKDCSQLSEEMTQESLEMMRIKSKGLLEVIKTKLDAGEISKENFDDLSFFIITSVGYAATALAALMIVEGPRFSPPEVLKIVDEKMRLIVSTLIAKTLGGNIASSDQREAIEGIIDILKKASDVRADIVGSNGVVDRDSNSKRNNDPNLN